MDDQTTNDTACGIETISELLDFLDHGHKSETGWSRANEVLQPILERAADLYEEVSDARAQWALSIASLIVGADVDVDDATATDVIIGMSIVASNIHRLSGTHNPQLDKRFKKIAAAGHGLW